MFASNCIFRLLHYKNFKLHQPSTGLSVALHKTFAVKFVVVTFLLRSVSVVGIRYEFCVARYYGVRCTAVAVVVGAVTLTGNENEVDHHRWKLLNFVVALQHSWPVACSAHCMLRFCTLLQTAHRAASCNVPQLLATRNWSVHRYAMQYLVILPKHCRLCHCHRLTSFLSSRSCDLIFALAALLLSPSFHIFLFVTIIFFHMQLY